MLSTLQCHHHLNLAKSKTENEPQCKMGCNKTVGGRDWGGGQG